MSGDFGFLWRKWPPVGHLVHLNGRINEIDITYVTLSQRELGWNVDKMVEHSAHSEPNCVHLHLYAHVLPSCASTESHHSLSFLTSILAFCYFGYFL